MRTLMLACSLFVAAITMAKPVIVNGTVLGSGAKPIAGAKVVASLIGADTHPETTTDTTGAFSFTVDLVRELKGRFVGYVTIYSPGLAVGGGLLYQGENSYTLSTPAQVSGTVVDTRGKPVAEAIVRLCYIGNIIIPAALQTVFTTRSDADGRWTINGIPPSADRANIMLDDPRFVHDLTVIGQYDPLVLHARPGGVITGRARFADGRPAPGIRVVCQGIGAHNDWSEIYTDDQGCFRLTGLSTGKVNVMMDDDSQDQWVAAALPDVQAIEGKVTAAGDLVLTSGAIIEGALTDKESGQPVPGVYIGCYGPHRPRSSPMVSSSCTDATGHYRLRVAPGTNYIYVTQELSDYLRPDGVDITVKAGETASLPFRLSKGIVLTGRLLDTDGKPVPDIDLPLALEMVRSGQGSLNYTEPRYARSGTGEFTFSGLKRGTGQLFLDYRSKVCGWELVSPLEVTIPFAGPLTVTLRRVPLETLSGRVVTPEQQPVAGVPIRVGQTLTVGELFWPFGQQVVSDANGAFTLSGILPNLQLTLQSSEKKGYRYLSGGQITRDNGRFVMTDIVLAPLGTTVRGTVVDAHGAPVAGALVTAVEAMPSKQVATNAAGEFSITDLPAGEVTLLAAHQHQFAALRITPNAPVTLKLMPATPQPKQDLARGAQMLQTLMDETAGTDYYAREFLPFELLPYDQQRALPMIQAEMKGYPGIGVTWILARNIATASAQVIDDHLQAIEQVGDLQEKLGALALMSAALAKRDRARALTLYEQAKALLENVAGGQAEGLIIDYSLLAQAAFRLNIGEGEKWVEQGSAVAKEINDDAGLEEAIAIFLADDAPQIAVKLFEALPGPSGAAHAIALLAQTDLAEARRRLAELPKDDARAGHSAYGYAAKALAIALVKDDPAGALTLARTITDLTFRVQALTAVAPSLTKEQAVEALQETAEMIPTDEQHIRDFITLATAIARCDPAQGEELIGKVRIRLEELGTEVPTLAYALREIDPAQSRLQLEWLVRQAPKQGDGAPSGWMIRQAALAMAPLDFERALEIARAIPVTADVPDRYDTERKLIQYLLAPEPVRATIPLDRWSASDTWRPGEPTER